MRMVAPGFGASHNLLLGERDCMSTNADASLTLVRNATVLATVGETTFLVDPLFAPQGALPPIDDTPNDRANPSCRCQTSTGRTTR